MKTIILGLLSLLFAGCVPPNVLLVHRKSGDMVECSSVGVDVGAIMANNYVDSCVKQWEGAGFVPVSTLTDEQRALIVPGQMIRYHERFMGRNTGQQSQGLGFMCKQSIRQGNDSGVFVHC